MALHRCFNNNQSGGTKIIEIPNCYNTSILTFNTDMTCMKTKFYVSGDTSGGKKSLWTYTASKSCSVYLPTWSYMGTNISNGDAYVYITINGTEVYKKYMPDNAKYTADFPAQINLQENDVFIVGFGFDGSHSGVKFALHTYPIIVSEN